MAGDDASEHHAREPLHSPSAAPESIHVNDKEEIVTSSVGSSHCQATRRCDEVAKPKKAPSGRRASGPYRSWNTRFPPPPKST
jgi:hypothetical protein